MKRDALVLEVQSQDAPQAACGVVREPLYFPAGESECFGWFHSAMLPLQHDCVAVICAPVGHEYTHVHRTLRHLADRLSLKGIPALRFDYHGIGDSPGSDFDPDRLAAWQTSLAAAIGHAKRLSGRKRVCVVGVRLGATLAALVSRAVNVDLLVLWNPCVSGRAYVRELQAIALSAARIARGNEGGALESAGFVTTAQTRAALSAINLLDVKLRVGDRALLLGRDDLEGDHGVSEHLSAAAIAHDARRAAGWEAMMAEHQFTIVPQAALESIVDWVALHSPHRWALGESESAVALAQAITFSSVTEADERVAIEEQWCRFGAQRHLFGILSRASAATERPAVVMFNAGAVHHVGPNRLYVAIARRLAALGFASFRFDLEGIGDSISRSGVRENHPYPTNAMADARSAFEHLRQEFGYRRFIALGLCSGAHSAFHAGLELEHENLCELVLINPLTFYWVEGMSLETTHRFEDMAAYRRSLRDPARWLKMLRGEVRFGRLLEVAFAHSLAMLKARYEGLREALLPATAPRLSKDLARLFALGRKLTLFIAQGDPGRDILMAGARRAALKALKSGEMHVEMVADADHTFTQSGPRAVLIERLAAHLQRRWGTPGAPNA